MTWFSNGSSPILRSQFELYLSLRRCREQIIQKRPQFGFAFGKEVDEGERTWDGAGRPGVVERFEPTGRVNECARPRQKVSVSRRLSQNHGGVAKVSQGCKRHNAEQITAAGRPSPVAKAVADLRPAGGTRCGIREDGQEFGNHENKSRTKMTGTQYKNFLAWLSRHAGTEWRIS